jgi:hypothetical protein
MSKKMKILFNLIVAFTIGFTGTYYFSLWRIKNTRYSGRKVI